MRIQTARRLTAVLFTLAEWAAVALWVLEMLRREPRLWRATAWVVLVFVLLICDRILVLDFRRLLAVQRPTHPLIIRWRGIAADCRRKASLMDSLRRPMDSVLADKAADCFAACADELEREDRR